MSEKLRKIIEKPVTPEEMERLKWLHKGIATIDEKGRKAAIEGNPKYAEKSKLLTPDEFQSLLFSKYVKHEDIPLKYQQELYRYNQMFISNISEILDMKKELKDVKLGKTIGIPDAKENIFELKKKGKRIGFVHINKSDKTIDFIQRLEDVPEDFKKKLKQ